MPLCHYRGFLSIRFAVLKLPLKNEENEVKKIKQVPQLAYHLLLISFSLKSKYVSMMLYFFSDFSNEGRLKVLGRHSLDYIFILYTHMFWLK
jgi:hypothetical protein